MFGQGLPVAHKAGMTTEISLSVPLSFCIGKVCSDGYHPRLCPASPPSPQTPAYHVDLKSELKAHGLQLKAQARRPTLRSIPKGLKAHTLDFSDPTPVLSGSPHLGSELRDRDTGTGARKPREAPTCSEGLLSTVSGNRC